METHSVVVAKSWEYAKGLMPKVNLEYVYAGRYEVQVQLHTNFKHTESQLDYSIFAYHYDF
jgi:hypothetical protein